MADITMCFDGCKLRDTCYRWIAPANPWRQSYSYFKPDENGVCNDYWPVEVKINGRRRKITTEASDNSE